MAKSSESSESSEIEEFEFDENESFSESEIGEGDIVEGVSGGTATTATTTATTATATATTEQEREKKRAEKEEKKKVLLERKAQKPNSNLIQNAKEIWEKLRQKRLSKKERRDLMKDMMGLVRGKCLEIIYKHDASRIVQCCVKYGSPEERDEVAAELDGHYASLSTSKYGRFIVSKILQYCSQKYRNAVIKDFHGKVRKLIRHKEASLVLDEAYSQYANAAQRSSLMEEFYGPEFAIFKLNDGSRGSLQDLIKTYPLKKQYVLKHTRLAINSVLEKSSFNVGKTPILHRAIHEYLEVAEPAACKDMIELLKDHLVHMLHTREGALVAQYCILHATPKDRKHIVKAFKGFMHSIAREQYGHAVLISCFECIDDTVLLGKAVLGELVSETGGPADAQALSGSQLDELMRHQYGSRVLLYLLTGRNKRYQPSYLIKELESTDETRAQTTKKDPEMRSRQLLEMVVPLLVPVVAKYTEELLRDRAGSLVLLETCNQASLLNNSQTESNVKVDISSIMDAVVAALKKSIATSHLNTTMASAASVEKENEGEEGVVVNVVKKMKAEKDAAAKKDQGIDLEESVLSARPSLLALKLLLAASSRLDENGQEVDPEWKHSLRQKVWGLLSPLFVDMVQQCAENPYTTSGLSFVFVALFEGGNVEIKESMKAAVKGKASLFKKSLENALASTTKDPSSKKRKADDAFKGGVSILLNHLVA